MTPDPHSFGRFVSLVEALTHTDSPPAPRSPGEVFLSIAATAFAGWRRACAGSVPVGELVRMRQRARTSKHQGHDTAPGFGQL